MMGKKNKCDEFHYHEAMDRTHVILCMFEDHVMSAPAIKEAGLEKKAKKISYQMAKLYQEIGKIGFDKYEN